MTYREMLDAAKEIIAKGCSCDRHCTEMIGPDVFCGCESDAAKIIEIVQNNEQEE